VHTASSSEDILFWGNSNMFDPSQRVSASAAFTPADDSSYGLIFRAADNNNYYSVRVVKGVAFFVVTKNGKEISSTQIGVVTPDEDGNDVELRVISSGPQFRIFVNGQQVVPRKTLRETTHSKAGGVGIFAQGAVTVADVHTGLSKNIKIHTKGCDRQNNTQDNFHVISKIHHRRIGDTTFVCKRTRDIDILEATFEVAGDNFGAVEAVESELQGMAETSDLSLAENEIMLNDAADAGADFLAEETAFEIAGEAAAADAAVAAEGASSATIGGAVAGGVVGTAAIVGGAVVVKKKVIDKKKKDTSAPAAQPAKPKGAGANVFDLDPTNHASITGRSQARAQAV
jgi:hypothetical protein